MNELEKAAREREIKVCPYEFRCSVSDECYLCQWGGASKQIRFAANESFVLGAQWQAKQSPWIDFNHQMPVENQLILVQAGYRQNVIHLVTYHDGEFYENGKEVNFVGDWMPIPELPKE